MLTGSSGERASSGAVAKIPGLVRRNTILLALSQALVGAGMQLIPSLGPLLSVELVGSAALAGVAVSIVGLSRFSVAYPLGRVMDAYGRRAGLLIGLALAIVGSYAIGVSVITHSFLVFVLGMFIFGLGIGAAQQIRLAAADMYPPSRRAEGLGYVLTGSVVGALGGPAVISVADALSPGLGLPPLATPWLIVPAVILPTIVLISRMRPDPKEIAAHLTEYYPDYVPDVSARTAERGSGGISAMLGQYPKMVAVVAGFAAQGTMSMVMAMSSLALAHHGHGLQSISLSVAVHGLGMFAFSLPVGKLSDAIGRRAVLTAGTFIALLGALLVPAGPDFWVITLGTFLVGLGWSCVNVAATAVIADTTRPHERGRAIGTNDAFASASGIILPLVAGPLVDGFGLTSIGVLGALVMVAPVAMAIRLREPTPGKYEDASVVRDRSRS